MCECGSLLHLGAEAAEALLRDVYLLDIEKASKLNPLNPVDFLVMVERLTGKLHRGTKKFEDAAVKSALEELDVDWAELSDAGRERAIEAASIALDAAQRGALPVVRDVFELQAPKMVKDTRAAVRRRFDLNIEAMLSATDKRIATFVRKSQTAFVTDAYGRRSDAFSARARATVARGLEQGLDRTAIAGDLGRMMHVAELARGEPYWRIVAAAMMNRARVSTQVAAFSEGRIDRFKFVAVMDEKTTEICRLLDGTIWAVPRAMETLERAMKADKPEDIAVIQPWVHRGKDDDGKPILYYNRADGARQVVAEIVRSAVGTRDDRGEFRSRMDPREMEAGGIQMPPLHELCRSTVVTEI